MVRYFVTEPREVRTEALFVEKVAFKTDSRTDDGVEYIPASSTTYDVVRRINIKKMHVHHPQDFP